MKTPPNPPGGKNQSDERYEVPFEEQKAEQDRAAETPVLDEAAYHGIVGTIARKVEDNSEADSRGILCSTVIGYGNILGRTACFRVNDTLHYCNEFACLVGNTGRTRKGLATDIVEAILGLVSDVWKGRCIARGLSSGEGLVELVCDEIRRQKKKKGPDGEPEFEIIKEAVRDKRKLVLLPEFGELLTMMTREGNTLSTTLRNAWDGRARLEVNTKQQPQCATNAHISIIGNITKAELLKLLPKVPNSDGFCNRFLWLLIQRLKYLPNGGPRVEKYLIDEIERLKKLVKFAQSLEEMHRSPEAEGLWNEIYMELSKASDMDRTVVDRADAHSLRLQMLYALLDGAAEIEPVHIKAAHALWRFSEVSALRLFGVEDLPRETHLVLDYLRAKGASGATRTEIQNRVFFNHKTGKEIQSCLRTLEERHLARYETERADNRILIERWFATQYSGSGSQNYAPGAEKTRKKDQFATGSQKHAKGSTLSSKGSAADFNTNSPNSPIRKGCKNGESSKNEEILPSTLYTSSELGELANSCREASPVKDSRDLNPCERVANWCTYAMTKDQVSAALTSFQNTLRLALDTETTNDSLRLVQLSDGESPPVILDAQKLDLKPVLVPLLKTKELIVQNSRFDLRILKNDFDLDISPERIFDTYIASALLTNTAVTEEEKRRRKRRD